MSEKWTLHHGIHRGTITSRDSSSAKYDSKAEALKAHRKNKKFYAGIGYKIWFAELIAPDGKKMHIESDSSYR